MPSARLERWKGEFPNLIVVLAGTTDIGVAADMTLRADHAAGSAFVVFGLIVLAISGDLPFGTLSFPGAGMMPKVVALAMMAFGIVLVLRAGQSVPLSQMPRRDFIHATRVAVITAAAIALYKPLGFIVTMTLMMFALIFGAERRHPVAAGLYSLAVTLGTYFLFTRALKTPLDQGILEFLGI
jgi:tripartite tricarboxylate transporter TctB family protein